MLPTIGSKSLSKMLLRLLLTVDKEETFDLLLVQTADIMHHLLIIAVTREGVDSPQFSAHFVALAENTHLLITTHNLSP